jgi:hypothetical protein
MKKMSLHAFANTITTNMVNSTLLRTLKSSALVTASLLLLKPRAANHATAHGGGHEPR